METIRGFIAVDIGDTVRERLDALQRKLKKVHADVRWTKPGTMHLTLAFLGDLPLEKIPLLQTALEEALQDQEPFELEITGTGYFGRRKHPRVIWAGIADCPPLMELRRKTVEALHSAEVEFDSSKPFSPHLTLGRVKKLDHHTESLLDRVERYEQEPLGQAHIDVVELIQSTLKPGGPEYTVLHRIRFPRPGIL